MNIEIYSKDACGMCVQAKSLIRKNCLDYQEYVLGKDVSLDDLRDRVQTSNSNKPVRAAPQIFIDGEHVGEYGDLVKFLSTNTVGCSA